MPEAHYTVEHETRYAYRSAVAQSWQLAHLTPRELPWQSVRAHELRIDPAPDERRDGLDSFGNCVTHFSLHSGHQSLKVFMRCKVAVGERPDPAASRHAPTWEDVRSSMRTDPAQDGLLPARMCEPTRLVPSFEAASAYAAASFTPGRAWLDATNDLMHRIHADFDFDPGSTTVSTSVEEVLHQRSGVCQDFAHLMLGCLRGHGLAARYMSGYLLTDPPPGRPRLLGADASHAWVAAYAPGHGWVEFDPTNDRHADQRYITLGWGADFADAVPLRGVLIGGRGQRMAVAVSVIPD
ncbi:MAG: transglutaminase family protein [Caldimonas sp.]